jgi:hypothetical protein
MACVAAGLMLTLCLPVEAAAPGVNCRHSACRSGLEGKDKVNAKGVKGASWKAEYAKCKADPASYN